MASENSWLGNMALTNDGIFVTGYKFTPTGDNWTETVPAGSNNLAILQCDADTGNAVEEIAQGYNPDAVGMDEEAFVTDKILAEVGMGAPAIKWIFGDAGKMYKVLRVLTNDSIEVDSVTSNGTVVNIYALGTRGYNPESVDLTYSAGDSISIMSFPSGTAVFDQTEGGFANIPLNLDKTGPLFITGRGNIIIH